MKKYVFILLGLCLIVFNIIVMFGQENISLQNHGVLPFLGGSIFVLFSVASFFEIRKTIHDRLAYCVLGSFYFVVSLYLVDHVWLRYANIGMWSIIAAWYLNGYITGDVSVFLLFYFNHELMDDLFFRIALGLVIFSVFFAAYEIPITSILVGVSQLSMMVWAGKRFVYLPYLEAKIDK